MTEAAIVATARTPIGTAFNAAMCAGGGMGSAVVVEV